MHTDAYSRLTTTFAKHSDYHGVATVEPIVEVLLHVELCGLLEEDPDLDIDKLVTWLADRMERYWTVAGNPIAYIKALLPSLTMELIQRPTAFRTIHTSTHIPKPTGSQDIFLDQIRAYL